MKDIYKTLAEKQKDLTALQREVDALRLAIKLLGDEGTAPIEGQEMSQPKMVVAILQAAHRPMHVKDIAEQMKKKFKLTVKVNNLGVMLYRYAARGRHFVKIINKPNTYGLIEWQNEESKVVAMG